MTKMRHTPSETPTIERMSITSLDIPLHHPFGIAGGTQEVARNLLVSLSLHGGTCGWGEAAPLPAFNGETQAAARSALESVRSLVEGESVLEWRRIAARVRERLAGASGAAQCAVETALLDALTRRGYTPLWAFFGGARTRLTTDMTIPLGSVQEAEVATHAIRDYDISTIKVKVGTGDIAYDVERVRTIARVSASAPLLLDGNAGFDASSALRLLAALRGHGIVPILFEQPVAAADWEGLRAVRTHGDVRVAADESASGLQATSALIREKAIDVVNIKLQKTGVAEAWEMVALCRMHRVGLMIGGMVESILCMTASACFAAGLGGFEFVDLDTPLFLAENPFVGGYNQQGDVLDLAGITAGHGVRPIVGGGADAPANPATLPSETSLASGFPLGVGLPPRDGGST